MGDPKYIFTIPRAILPKPSLCDEIMRRNQTQNHRNPIVGSRSVCSRSVCRGQLTWLAFIFEGKVLMICKHEKTLEWAKQVVEAIVPSLVVHQGYDAKGPKDLPLAKTFEIWLSEDEGLSISYTLTLVSRYNAKISCRDLETKHSANRNGGVLHVVSIREPSLTTLKELNYNPYAGYRRVQFQKKKSAKQFQNLETSLRLPKGDETCEAIMDTAEPGTLADTEKPTTSSS